jgi:hypothetical protein
MKLKNLAVLVLEEVHVSKPVARDKLVFLVERMGRG